MLIDNYIKSFFDNDKLSWIMDFDLEKIEDKDTRDFIMILSCIIFLLTYYLTREKNKK
jgi:hypothetical protein